MPGFFEFLFEEIPFVSFKFFMEQSWEMNCISIVSVYLILQYFSSFIIQIANFKYYYLLFLHDALLALYRFHLTKKYTLTALILNVLERLYTDMRFEYGNVENEKILQKVAHIKNLYYSKSLDKKMAIHYDILNEFAEIYEIESGKLIVKCYSPLLPEYVNGITLIKFYNCSIQHCIIEGGKTRYLSGPVSKCSFTVNPGYTLIGILDKNVIIIIDTKTLEKFEFDGFCLLIKKIEFVSEDCFAVHFYGKAEDLLIYKFPYFKKVGAYPKVIDFCVIDSKILAMSTSLDKIKFFNCEDLLYIDEIPCPYHTNIKLEGEGDDRSLKLYEEKEVKLVLKIKDYDNCRTVLFLILCARKFSPTSPFFVYEIPTDLLKIILLFCGFPSHIPKRIKV